MIFIIELYHLDEISCFTKDKYGNIAILLFNPCIESMDGEPLIIELEIPSEIEVAIVSIQKVDNENGNAFTAWKKIGRPRWPNKEKLEIIKKAQYPIFEIIKVKSDNGKIKIIASLPTNGIQLIEIMKFEDYSYDYQGLREVEII